VENELSEPVTIALNDPQPNTWHKIIEAYKTTVENGQATLSKKAKSKCFCRNAWKSNNHSPISFK
jgi:hypothetical protein